MRSNDPRIVFGRQLRELRTARGISQERLAERLAELAGLHRNYVGGVERGEYNIALLNIVALARALRVKAAKLIEPLP